MEMLESAMAFAVAMMIFSTVVTGIVELIVRLLGAREKNLRNTIESLFKNVIWPRLKIRLMESGGETGPDAMETLCSDFVNRMTGNPASARAKNIEQEKRKRAVASAAYESEVDVLTPIAFAERLGRTDVGKAILAEGESQLELLVQDFVRTFDRFGRAASEIYRKFTQQWAIVVGIVLALAINIDAGRLYTTLMKNPDLRSGLIAQAEDAAKANREAAESLKKVADGIKDGTYEAKKDDLEKQLKEVKTGIEALKGQGMPIGYAYFPYCVGAETEPACKKEGTKYFTEFLSWVTLAVLAGVLIGLGGPFWFRVFSSLSQVFQVLRTLGVAREQAPAKPKDADATPAAEESAKPKSIIDAFQVAAQIHAHASRSSARALLGPDGEPL